ncbi:MAG: hypothetical protein ACYC21_07025 [Eubacteriales bacterium]
MTWVLIVIFFSLGFAEYWCTHYFTQKIFRISENRAHLVLGGLVVLRIGSEKKYLASAFLVVALFTPFLAWLGIKLSRNI